jgi:hypothetical protein
VREILGDQLHQQSSKFNLRLGSGVQRTKTRSKAAASSTISCRSGCWGTSSATHLRQGRAKSLSWAFICVFVLNRGFMQGRLRKSEVCLARAVFAVEKVDVLDEVAETGAP